MHRHNLRILSVLMSKLHIPSRGRCCGRRGQAATRTALSRRGPEPGPGPGLNCRGHGHSPTAARCRHCHGHGQGPSHPPHHAPAPPWGAGFSRGLVTLPTRQYLEHFTEETPSECSCPSINTPLTDRKMVEASLFYLTIQWWHTLIFWYFQMIIFSILMLMFWCLIEKVKLPLDGS